MSLGGASILGGTQAFSRVDATRGTSLQTAGEENALLGVEPVASVEAGTDNQPLVDLTNNTDDALDVTVALDDSSQGSVSPSTPTLGPGSSTTVTVDVDADSPTGVDALPFSVSATASGDGDFSVSLERAVAVTAGPLLERYVKDTSSNSSAGYEVQYSVENVPEFDRVEMAFVSQDNGWASGSGSSTESASQITYSEGGAMGDLYEITIDVYDTSGEIALQEQFTDVADGANPDGNDDLGSPNGPVLEGFSVDDTTLNNTTEYALSYEVSNLEEFGEVAVTFENLDSGYATETVTNSDAPTGTVNHDSGGTEGDTYEITVVVLDTNGFTSDEATITDVADGSDPADYP